jgi:hypothetical protein
VKFRHIVAQRLVFAILCLWILASMADVEQNARGSVTGSCGALIDASGKKVIGLRTGTTIKSPSSGHCVESQKPPEPMESPAPQTEPVTAVPKVATPVIAKRAIPKVAVKPEQPVHADPKPELVNVEVTITGEFNDDSLNLALGDAERIAVAAITVGGLIWALRTEFWAALLIFGLPLWRHVDLVPILAQEADQEAMPKHPVSAEEREVAQVLDRTSTNAKDVNARS